MTESRIAPPVRVLVADSGAGTRRTVAEALTRKGFTVEMSENAEDAFEKVRVFRPNLVFYDLELPGYDGFEATALVSRMRFGREGFIIATSMHRGSEVAARARAAGAWDFLYKPLAEQDILQTALAIKRHLQRPNQMPRKAAHSRLKVTSAPCGRPDCQTQVAGFAIKDGTPAKQDQFETPIYAAGDSAEGSVDYNLVSVAVCPECYFAVDVAASQKPQAGAGAGAAAAEPLLFRIAASADDTLFSEDRTPSAALVAFRLAIESQKSVLTEDSPEMQGKAADLAFKAASIAHRSGDERQQDRFLAEAEKFCTDALAMDSSAAVYRAAYRLVALYVFFMRDLDAAKTLKRFDKLERPSDGRMKPRDSRLLATYRALAANIVADRNFYRRTHYLAELK